MNNLKFTPVGNTATHMPMGAAHAAARPAGHHPMATNS